MASILRALTAEEHAEPGVGMEKHIQTFLDRADRLHTAFALAAARKAAATDEHEDESSLRADIAALQTELREKDELLAKHRERLRRWQAECDAVSAQANAVAVCVSHVNPPRQSTMDVSGP